MVIGIIPTAMEVKNHSEEERTEHVLFVNSQVLYTVIILFAFIATCGYHYYLLICQTHSLSETRGLMGIGYWVCSYNWLEVSWVCSATKSMNIFAQQMIKPNRIYVYNGHEKWLCCKNGLLTRRCIRSCDHGFLYIYYQHPLRSILSIITTHINHVRVEILISESCCASGYDVIEAGAWRVIGDVEVEGLGVGVR